MTLRKEILVKRAFTLIVIFLFIGIINTPSFDATIFKQSSIFNINVDFNQNNPPYEPSNPFPPDGATNVSCPILSWTGGDPDPYDNVTYALFFGDTYPPDCLYYNGSNTQILLQDIDYNTTYYWKIIAWDNHGASTEGPIWSFTTESPQNNPPNTLCILLGTIGENGWYVSDVFVIFEVIPGTHEVAYTLYNLDESGWVTYVEPFLVTTDGVHTLRYYSVDIYGNIEEIQTEEFKIDQTSPTIYLTTEKIGPNTWLLMADVCDETSGIAKVEFYIDGEFVGEVTEEPYEWIYNHNRFSVRGLILNPKITEETISFFTVMAIGHSIFNNPTAQAIVYDNAGNDGISIPYTPINNNRFGIYLFQQLTFQNDYSGYIGKHFISAVFEYGPWGELEVTMPMNQQTNSWWFFQFLQNHPRMFPILRLLLGL